MKLNEYKYYYNKNDVYYTLKKDWTKVNEQKFKNLNTKELIPEFPINQKIQFDKNKMIKAIQFGMILVMDYKGEDDETSGHERTFSPLNLGTNKNTGNLLLRSYHLDGYSVKEKRNVQKVWRLFNTENIKWMMFTGDFLRMPPSGYKMNDRIFTETTISRADFNVIRKNQHKLVQSGQIQPDEAQKINSVKDLASKIEIKNTGTVLTLARYKDNEYVKNVDIDEIKLTFMKSIFGNDTFAILGALGTPGKTVKIFEGKELKGTYKTIEVVVGKEIKNKRNIKGQMEFDLFVFVKKIN